MKGDIFHLLNRGVEKRTIFLSEKGYLRFVYNLYDFNDVENVDAPYPQRRKAFSDVGRPKKKKDKLVDVLCWCLMPNHPHVLVHEKVDRGTSIFSKKIIGGYTKYFNEKNKRNGVLFQGKSKIIQVTNDPHFLHLPFYIMSNPIELIEPKWREKGVQDLGKVMRFLENYKYSSFPDLVGKESFPFLINKELFYKLFDTTEAGLKESFAKWLKQHKNSKVEIDFGKHEL